MEELKVLELFSGVGGYHSALEIIEGKMKRHKMKVIGAVDINTVSNEVRTFLFSQFLKLRFSCRFTGTIIRTRLVSREISLG